MDDRKRKRDSNKHETPKKRVAIAPPSSQRVVKVSFLPSGGDLEPIVASTPGLSLSSKITLNPYKKQDKNSRSHELLLQSSSHPKLDYLAREEPHGSADSATKDYIGVYDPEAGKLQLIEVRKVVIRSSLRRETQEMQRQREEASNQAMRAQTRYELGLEFGSARTVKAITARTQNIISPQKGKDGAMDSTARAVLNSVASAAADMPTKEMMQAAIDKSKPRPRPNLEASTPAEVYPLETLLPPGALAAIEVKEWIDAIAANEDVMVPSLYVSKRLKVLAQHKKNKKLKALRYVLLLLNLNNSLKGKGKGPKLIRPREELLSKLGASNSLIDGTLRKFAAGREMSKWHVDNLVTHICALALFVDDYEVDTFDLQRDLNIESKQIQQYFQEIGCKIAPATESQRIKHGFSKAEAASHKFAKLKIPPTFPKTRVRARAGTRR